MAQMAQAFRGFVKANRRVSKLIEKRMLEGRPSLHQRYPSIVATYVNRQYGQTVVDLGAGKRTPFADLVEMSGAKIVGVDVSEEEMLQNPRLAYQLVANAEERIPLSDGEVDVLVSRSTLEHFTNVRSAAAEIFRVLDNGGYTIHLFPSKNAPFSIINRMLPRKLSLKLLSTLMPGTEGILGFPAYYDSCSPSEMREVFSDVGFEVLEEEVSYSQSTYFGFFVPLYLLSLAYEAMVRRLNIELMAGSVLIVAQKPRRPQEPDGALQQ